METLNHLIKKCTAGDFLNLKLDGVYIYLLSEFHQLLRHYIQESKVTPQAVTIKTAMKMALID